MIININTRNNTISIDTGIKAFNFDESKVKRDDDGQFASKDGGSDKLDKADENRYSTATKYDVREIDFDSPAEREHVLSEIRTHKSDGEEKDGYGHHTVDNTVYYYFSDNIGEPVVTHKRKARNGRKRKR